MTTLDAILAAFWQGDTDYRTQAPCTPPAGDAMLGTVYTEGWDFAESCIPPNYTLALLQEFDRATPHARTSVPYVPLRGY